MSLPETPRLRLTFVRPADFDHIWRLQSDPAVMRYIRPAETDPNVVHDRMKMWDKYQNDHAGLGVVILWHQPDDQFAGYAVIRHVNFQAGRDLEVGYTIAPEFAGRGLATELTRALTSYAFEAFSVPRIVAFTDPENAASRHVLEKCGFSYAGVETVYSENDAFFVLERGRGGVYR